MLSDMSISRSGISLPVIKSRADTDADLDPDTPNLGPDLDTPNIDGDGDDVVIGNMTESYNNISSLTQSSNKIQVPSSSIIIINDGKEIVKLIKKLDAAVQEVIQLLTYDSLGRFYDSNEYQRMITNLKVKE